jgi:hypothetical protein
LQREGAIAEKSSFPEVTILMDYRAAFSFLSCRQEGGEWADGERG